MVADTKHLFFFFLPELWSLLYHSRKDKNPFVMLDCKEHAFSRSVGSFNENSLTGHHGGCWRYRPVWLGSCHGIITSHGDTVLARGS